MKNRTMLASMLAALLLAPAAALAAGGGAKLDRAPVNLQDAVSLQRGAQVFVNYCLNCHSAQFMRYNRLTDLGLTEEQIRDNLLLAGDKVGDLMTIAMDRRDAAAWFGGPAPDLTVIARSRGADWLYTYLRTFYREEGRATGWNNLAFPMVGMPHVLWELQGVQELREEKAGGHTVQRLVLVEPGKLSRAEYDTLIADLVNYLVYMGEPAAVKRSQVGIVVIIFLSVLFLLAYLLKKEYWKDVH